MRRVRIDHSLKTYTDTVSVAIANLETPPPLDNLLFDGSSREDTLPEQVAQTLSRELDWQLEMG